MPKPGDRQQDVGDEEEGFGRFGFGIGRCGGL